MIDTVYFTFHFRWISWGVAAAIAVLLLFRRQALFEFFQKFELVMERHFTKALSLVCLSWFTLAGIAKGLQLSSFSLNAQDFWLFVDVLDQMKNEGYMLTRFAPQGMGWVQHGAIHSFLPLLSAKPGVWLLGAKNVALLFNPFALALGGMLLGLLARRKWGALGALLIVFAFFSSSYTGKILMYDMHPEALYPALLFLWGVGMGLAARPARMPGWAVAIGALGGLLIKEDAVFLFFPLFVHWAINSRGPQRRSAIVSLVLGGTAYFIQLYALRSFADGSLGPQTWLGTPVSIPQGPVSLASSLLDRAGGPGTWALSTLHFFVQRPFLTLLAVSPWVMASPSLWASSALLGALVVSLGEPAKLWNYYSAPFLALFWFVAATLMPVGIRFGKIRREAWLAWMIVASCALGSGGISWTFASDSARALRAETRALEACVLSAGGAGIIAPALLSAVSDETRARAWTDRAPRTPADWARTHFVLLAPGLPRFEMGEDQIQALLATLHADPSWKRVDVKCNQVTFVGDVQLYLRTGALVQKTFLKK